MWYNAVTPLGIIAVLVAIPCYVSPYINKFFIGNPNGRLYDTTIEYVAYARDYELAGKKIWKFNGLEVIPDK